MTSNSVTPSSLIFQIQKGPRGEQTSQPSEPVLWTSGSAQAGGNASAAGICCVCQKNAARYKCPKCSVVYCSNDCYKNHKGEGSDCTEIFYHDRVSRIVSLENAAKREDFDQILRRIHAQQQENDAGGYRYGPKYTQEELLNMLHVLDSGDEQKVSDILLQRPELKAALDVSLQRGELSEWLLVPWHPWWRVEFANNADAEDVEVAPDNERDYRSLDDRLLAVTPFHALRPNGKEVPRQLRFNVLDILFSIVSTLRLFHGCQNAIEVSTEASDFLIQSSHVLSKDVRFESMRDVLLCISESYANQHLSIDASMIRTIFKDMALILSNRRLLGRALLEASDILESALTAKPKSKLFKKIVQKCRRKIEFYLAWSLNSEIEATFFEALAKAIEVWLADWDLQNLATDMLELPHLDPSRSYLQKERPMLIQDVCTVKTVDKSL